MKDRAWEHFEHGADIGVRGFGPTPEDAFGAAALALTAIVTDPARVKPLQPVEIECREVDPELLFVDWLNRVIYEMAVRGMLFGRFQVTLDGKGGLRGTLTGEPLDRVRHEPAVELKGATFTSLEVRRLADGTWVAQCVVDV